MVSSVNWILRRQYLPSMVDAYHLSVIDGLIEKFSCNKNDEYYIHGEMGMPLPPFVARFSPVLLGGNLLSIADEDGHVKLLDTRKQGNSSLVKEWSAHSNAVFDVAWVEDQPKLVTASGDQTARLWDVEKAETIGIFRGHTCSLKSVAIQPQIPSVFVSGARDGNIMVWDTRCFMRNGFHNPVNTIRGAHVLPLKDSVSWSSKRRKTRRTSLLTPDSKQSVTTVVFQDKNTVISAGACDGALKLWDIRKNYSNFTAEPLPYHLIPYPEPGPRKHGYSALVLDSTKSKLFAVCTNDTIYEYCCSTLPQKPVATYLGHTASSFYIKATISPDDKYLLCGSGDSCAYIWRIDRPDEPPWMLSGHLGEVTSVAWSPNSHGRIVTCSDDNTFKIWRISDSDHSAEGLSGKCERSRPAKGTAPVTSTESLVGRTSATLPSAIEGSCQGRRPSMLPLDLRPNRRLRVAASSMNSSGLQRTLTSPTSNVIFHGPVESVPVTSTMTRRKSKLSTVALTSHMLSALPKVCTPSASTLVSPSSNRQNPELTTPRSSRTFMEMWLSAPDSRARHRRVPPDSPSKKMRVSLLSRDKLSTCTGQPTCNDNAGGSSVVLRIGVLPVALEEQELAVPGMGTTVSFSDGLTSEESGGLDATPKSVNKKRRRDLSSIKTFVLVTKRKRDSSDSESPVAKHVRSNSDHTARSNKENDGVLAAALVAESEKITVDLQQSAYREVSPLKNALSEHVASAKRVKDLLDHAEDS